ncbi:MAG: hypothetical protein ACKVS6_03975 [Planctomycetota bacterium]
MRAKSGSRSARPADDDDDGEERKNRYTKAEDPTTKIITIVALVLLVVGGGISAFLITQKNSRDTAAALAISNSSTAISEIRAEFKSKEGDDSALDGLEALITRNAPKIITANMGELEIFKNELKLRREAAASRKKFNEIFEYLKANINTPAKADEVATQMLEAYKYQVYANDAQRKDLASFKILNESAILENRYQIAVSTQEKNPENWPVITEAFTIAEEWFTGEAQQLIRNAGLQGSGRAKELFQTIQEQVNRAADYWATSDKYGFKSGTTVNMMDAKEFAKDNPHWVPTTAATYSLEGGKLITKGLPNAEGRAGVLRWGPNGSKVSTMANGKDILPGTRETMRHYELTMKFKVVKKGFTLLARESQGFQRHEYSFETQSAQDERKSASKKIKTQSTTPAKEAGGIFGDMPAEPTAGEFNFFVTEGKTYEVREQCYGNKIMIWVKEEGGEEIEPLQDNVRARYGGVGIQLLPNSEIHFESMSVKILM